MTDVKTVFVKSVDSELLLACAFTTVSCIATIARIAPRAPCLFTRRGRKLWLQSAVPFRDSTKR